MNFVCPVCRVPVEFGGDRYRCGDCDRDYPVVFGIPDFRIDDDPYITIEDDRAKGLRIAEEAGTTDLRGLLEFYWSITTEVEAERAGQYVESVLASGARGADLFEWAFEAAGSEGETLPKTILEIGCGAGGLLGEIVESMGKGRSGVGLVGVDRAFRWLVVAKIWLEASGRRVHLVCANADKLPFAEGAFDLVIAESVLEHNDGGQGEIVCEVGRVLSEEGCFIAATPNRLAPIPDPHMGVLGLGLFPASLRGGIVRFVKGKPYRFIKLIGPMELRRLCSAVGLGDATLAPARFGERMRARFGALGRFALGVYDLLWTFGPTRMILAWTGPIIWIRARRKRS